MKQGLPAPPTITVALMAPAVQKIVFLHMGHSSKSINIAQKSFGCPPSSADPTPRQTLLECNLRRFGRGAEGTLRLIYPPLEPPGEGLRCNLALLARAEGRG